MIHGPLQANRLIGLGWMGLLIAVGSCSSADGQAASVEAAWQQRLATPQAPGDVIDSPGAEAGETQRFFVDANSRGRASEIRIVQLSWGRMVDVLGLDAQGGRILQQRDLVIDPDLDSDGVNFLLERNPITQTERLVILRDVTDTTPGAGLDQFVDLLRVADSNLAPIAERDLPDAGLFSMVPRNSTVVVQFDDLLDADLVNSRNIHLRTGNPPVVPFELRVLPDTNHGALAVLPGESERRFFTTRALLDFAVSELEAFAEVIPVNPLGLPASTQTVHANILLRIPTQTDFILGQDTILRNPTGGPLARASNGPVDFSTATIDVVRAARSGGPTTSTGDPYNGFLVDVRPPQVVGTQEAILGFRPRPIPGGSPFDFTLPQLKFESTFCAQAPAIGDVIEIPGFFAEVRAVGAVNANGEVFDLPITLLAGDPVEFHQTAIGPARYLTTFEPLEDVLRAACFVTIRPTPASSPTQAPSRISTGSIFELRFSEPLDVPGFEPHETLALTRAANPTSGTEYFVGNIEAGLGLTRFSFVPTFPLAHTSGSTENTYLTLGDGQHAPVDVVGNSLVDVLPQVAFRIHPDEPTSVNAGRVTRFTSADEELPIGDAMTGPLPEWTGQFSIDQAAEVIHPRPVTRMLASADRSQSLPAAMVPFAPGVQNPLSPFGAKTMTGWRYVDVGFGIADVNTFNMDVEGLNWSPTAGQVVSDNYAHFEIRLFHGGQLPDEAVNPLTLFPEYPDSGLQSIYDANRLDGSLSTVVHPRYLGYSVDPGDQFVSASGTNLMPFPLNRSIPPTERRTYTWRDTSIEGRGAQNGDGADPLQVDALGLPRTRLYSEGEVRSVGLPLMMDFRCFPDSGAIGLNAFDVSLAVNSSIKPYFRAFSRGGVDSNGSVVVVDPDLESRANGGFDPTTGAPTPGTDPMFYIGAMDLVVRVSRVVSIWFSTESATGSQIASPHFAPAMVFPPAHFQPPGTSVEIAYRGAASITAGSEVLTNGLSLDAYGDNYPTGVPHDSDVASLDVSFFGDDHWAADSNEIDGAPYYQVRASLRSNIATGQTATISSIGQAWSD